MELLKIKKITSLEKVFPDQEPSGEGMEDVITEKRDGIFPDGVLLGWSEKRKSTGAGDIR